MWKAAQAADGRQYYYNTATNATTWEKPEDFDENASAPVPVAAAHDAGAWKEASAADGRTYYYNTATNATSWEKPAGFVPSQAPSSAVTLNGDSDRRLIQRDSYRDLAPADRGGFQRQQPAWETRNAEGSTFRGARADEPEHANPADAEAAFFKFLRLNDVKYDTEWRDVIRNLGREKGFRAFKEPWERKQAFDKYCAEEKIAEKSREQERKQKQRDQFKQMLKLHDEIKHYTQWKSALPLIERELVFKSVTDEDERREIFREHVVELQKRHAEDEAESRNRALSELSSLMRTLVVSSDLKWEDVLNTIESDKRFVNDKASRALSKLDILRTYEAHIRTIDADRNATKQQQKHNQYRGQRQTRDRYKELLQEQLKAGNIRASTKWMSFYPRIADDPRYRGLVGMPGSTPIELFWDLIENEDHRLRPLRNLTYDVLESREFELKTDTEFAEFEDLMRRDNRTRDITPSDLHAIYDKLIEKVKRREEAERVQAEKHLHDAIDALRSAIKRARPPVQADDKFEDVASLIDAMPEARVMDEAARRIAFDKHIKRLQEKANDREKDRVRRDRDRDQRGGSRRSYDEDRERDRRNRTHSPELDAYEEDRRKAQAVRERQYRKASFGLTPPPRDRRDDRDRRDRHDGVYDRERKERELERQRSYMSRADPRDRGKISTLDYGDDDTGDSVPGSTRKRRESDISASSKRDPKRARRAETESSAPQAMDVDRQEVALQSGSEEGEIEEV